MMMCVTLAPKGLSFKTKRERGSQRMMLCEPERGHRGEEGGEGRERGRGLDTMVALVPLMASPPRWAGDVRWQSPPRWSRQMALGCGAAATLTEHRNWLLQPSSARS